MFFAIDIYAYAVMSNHYHLVLPVDRRQAASWDNAKVIEQWQKLYKIPLLVARHQRGETTSYAESVQAGEMIATWRQWLTDTS